MRVCNPPIPNPEQPQYKRLKSYSMSGANYKKNNRTEKTKEEGTSHLDPSRGGEKQFKGLPDGARVLQLWLASSLVKSH